MSKRVLLFAPAAFNLAETSRMVEIAKGIAHHPKASQAFDIRFISDGGDFESLIAKSKAEAFAKIMEQWDGPRMAAELLLQKFGQ